MRKIRDYFLYKKLLRQACKFMHAGRFTVVCASRGIGTWGVPTMNILAELKNRGWIVETGAFSYRLTEKGKKLL